MTTTSTLARLQVPPDHPRSSSTSSKHAVLALRQAVGEEVAKALEEAGRT